MLQQVILQWESISSVLNEAWPTQLAETTLVHYEKLTMFSIRASNQPKDVPFPRISHELTSISSLQAVQTHTKDWEEYLPLKCWFGPPKYGIIIQGPNKAPWQLPKQLMCLSHHALLNVSSILTMMNAYLTSFLFLVILLTNTSEKIALIQMSSIHRPETHQNCVWAFIFTNLKKISIFKTAVLSNTCSISKTQTASFSWFSMQNLMHQEATEYLT